MYKRHISPQVLEAAARNPVVTLLGPRQSGKTTLCRALFPGHNYLTLEAPDVRSRALDDPRELLKSAAPMIIDEVQRAPDLLSYVQVAVDEDPRPGRFVLTGSQNLLLMRSVSQTLAGRTALLRLLPLSFRELAQAEPLDPASLPDIEPTGTSHDRWETLFTGFYPRIHDRDLAPEPWYADYFRTYVERDLGEIINIADLRSFENFVRLAAASTAMELNLSRMASDIGVGQQTARRWLNALEIGFLAVLLPPHFTNFRKRLRKRPRLHFLDTGLLCYLLGIRDARTLARHPLRGAIFESFVVAELCKSFYNQRRDAPLHVWRDATGHEIDVLIDQGQTLLPVEIKSGETVPADAVRNLAWWTALPENPNQRGALVHGGTQRFRLKGFEVLPWYLG